MRRPLYLPLLTMLVVACDDPSSGTNQTTTPTTSDQDATTSTDVEPDSSATTTTTEPDTTTGPVSAHTVTLMDNEAHNIVLGGSSSITFTVPENVISVSISVTGDPAPTFGLGKWEAPASNLVYEGWTTSDDGAGQMCLGCDNRIAVSPGAFAAIAPNNPEASVTSGVHEITLFGMESPEVVDGQGPCNDDVCTFINQFQGCSECNPTAYTGQAFVTVMAKVADTPGAGLPATGVLDLNLHFTGAQGITAANAATDPTFQGYLQTMRDAYAQAGITIGEVTYRDIDARFKMIETIQGAESDLQEMFRLSSTNGLNALDLYFVDEISSESIGGFGAILGLAGGIPGPPLMQGTHRSGVAIAVKPVAGTPDDAVALTMAHETGHFLGLFHTSEQGFTGIHDPLPDTPQNDDSYLMFNNPAGTTLSEWQGRVMRSNPWVRHPVGE